jgi:hypothetical protein
MGSYRSATIYTLHIRLEHIEPLIWRRVIVPGQISLYKLHQFLQVIMGWENYHLHMFYIGEKQYGEPDPDYDDIVIKRDKHALFYAVAPVEGMHLRYEYDFGDGWSHDITVEKIEHLDQVDYVVPRCLEGARAAPVEDCGGVWGYTELVEALRDPAHPEHERLRTWAGPHYDPQLFSVQQANSALAVLE